LSAASIIVDLWSRWIDDVTAGLKPASSSFRRARVIELREQGDGSFSVTEWRRGAAKFLTDARLRLVEDIVAGPENALELLVRSHVHVILSSSRFLFRSIELPRGADQFVDGVVKSQIDRLTPWPANDAVYGWSPPSDAGPARIAVTIAATARALIEPIVNAVRAKKPGSIRISTEVVGEGTIIPVWSERSDQSPDRRMRRHVQIVFGAAGLSLLASLLGWLVAGTYLETREKDIEDQIARRRSQLMQQSGSAMQRAAEALQARKRTAPSAVIVMEELSKTLPDDTHLTELRIEEGKVQIVGLAQDAPALIRLIEQSGKFSQATFFAATVRAPKGGDTFHIEARPEPPFSQSNRN